MDFDSQLLHDILDFLSTLRDVPLPTVFESLRATLIDRMQAALSAADSYIDMQHGKGLQLKLVPDNNSSEEYIISDQHLEQNKKAVDIKTEQPICNSSSLLYPPKHAPTLSRLSPSRAIHLPNIAAEENKEVVEISEITEIYGHMYAQEAEAKSRFSGQLQRRERRFLFESLRPFWAAVVDSYFLSYDIKCNAKPTQIVEITGCTCRPVIPLTSRNTKKMADSTFELCYENNKSFQFVASTPKEMEQWIAAIRRSKPKTQDADKVCHLPNATFGSATNIAKAKLQSYNSNLSEEYEDIVILDIADELANPRKYSKPNTEASPVGQPEIVKSALHSATGKSKYEVQKAKSNFLPIFPKRINRDLPLPPSPSKSSQHDSDEVYNVIEESDNIGNCQNFGTNLGQIKCLTVSDEKLYDDIDTVKKEVERIGKMEDCETKIGSIDSGEGDGEIFEETYDDVAVVKRDAEILRRNENATKELTKVEMKKKAPKELPKTPSKPLLMKGFLGKLRHQKYESPPKHADTQPIDSSPQQQDQSATKLKLSFDQSPVQNNINNQTSADLSNYNSPPSPRPVQDSKHVANDTLDVEEEAMYDDVAVKKVESTESKSEKRKKADKIKKINLGSGEGHVAASRNIKPHKNVVRKLSEDFQAQIYQNQSGNANIEDDSEHYQVPRADANSHVPVYLENTDVEEIYDDIAIVIQKKRECERITQKPVVQSPSKSAKVPSITKTSENNLFNKIQKLSLSVSEKSGIEKKIQSPFNAKTKPKVQEGIKPLKSHEITSGDSEIYDDCLANGSINSPTR